MIFLCRLAQRDLPVYKVKKDDSDSDGHDSDADDDENAKKELTDEFEDKANHLLTYIEKTYLKGMVETDEEGKRILDKMKGLATGDNSQRVQVYNKHLT